MLHDYMPVKGYVKRMTYWALFRPDIDTTEFFPVAECIGEDGRTYFVKLNAKGEPQYKNGDMAKAAQRFLDRIKAL